MWPHVGFLGLSRFVRCRQLSHCGVVLVQQPRVSGEQLVGPVPLSAATSPSAPDTPAEDSAETSSRGGISVSRHHGEVWLFGHLSRNTAFILKRGGGCHFGGFCYLCSCVDRGQKQKENDKKKIIIIISIDNHTHK